MIMTVEVKLQGEERRRNGGTYYLVAVHERSLGRAGGWAVHCAMEGRDAGGTSKVNETRYGWINKQKTTTNKKQQKPCSKNS